MPEGHKRKDDCCFDMGQRVATLEANQLNVAKVLDNVVTKIDTVVTKLAERRGAEKIVFAIGGAVLTLGGAVIEYWVHK